MSKTNAVFKSAITVALSVSLLVSAGCGRKSGGLTTAGLTNNRPSITSVSSNKSAITAVSETATITVLATDPDNDNVTITAAASSGTITKTSSTTFTYTAPQAGEFTITVTAADPSGAKATATTTITSFGVNATDGGVAGSIKVPISSYRVAGETATENLATGPITAGELNGRDVSRIVRFGNKTAAPESCARQDFVNGELLIELKSGTDLEEFASFNGISVIKNRAIGSSLVAVNIDGLSDEAAKGRTLAKCKELNENSAVEYADLNGIVKKKSTIPNDPRYDEQWDLPFMNLPLAWDITTGSSNVIVAVIDTGIVAMHSDLASKLVAGYDFVSDPDNGCDGNGIDSNPEDVSDTRCIINGVSTPITPISEGHSGYHGSHVAGTIGAASNNGVGISGVAWGTKIMPLRALGRLGGTDDDIIQAMLFAAGLANDSGTVPAVPAKIINMSLGGDPPGACPAAYNAIFTQLYNAGVLVFVAAGNEYEKDGGIGNGAVNPTALCTYAVGVGAVSRYSIHAWYSNVGPGVDISAPGGDTNDVDSDGILSTVRNDQENSDTGYKFMQGTSMATPHAAGVAALMIAANPAITPSQIVTILAQTATDLGLDGTDDIFGAGMINAYAAVKAAKDLVAPVTPPANPVIALSTDKLYFAPDETSKTVIITNTGSGSLSLTSVSDTEASGGNWLSVQSTAGTGKITLDVTVSRGTLASGQYTDTINIVSNGGTKTIAVTMQVNAPVPTPPVGCQDFTLYILALDENTLDTVAQGELDTSTGTSYKMFEAPAGNYYVVAGTDCNKDDDICDQDIDFCGIYPLEDAPYLVSVTAKAFSQNIDFSITKAISRITGSYNNNSLSRKSFKRIK